MPFKDVLKFYPDFPEKGINFVDIMPLLQDRDVFAALMEEIGSRIAAPTVAAPEARGFFFATPLLTTPCHVTNVVPFRKKGKLPHTGDDLQKIGIMKEYGSDEIFFRKSDIAAGEASDGVFHIAILDDILATGGTAEGIARALNATKIEKGGREYGVRVTGFLFIAELDSLGGRRRLEPFAPVHSIIHI